LKLGACGPGGARWRYPGVERLFAGSLPAMYSVRLPGPSNVYKKIVYKNNVYKNNANFRTAL
jgi:hypothetical protein